MRKYEEEMMMETKAQNKKGPAPWKERLWNEDGTALFMAVVAALLLLVFALSFSSLSNLEARIGINDYRARQAQMVAEAGFEAVRNHLRPVLTDYANFLGNTYTCDASGTCTCTTGAPGTAAGVDCNTNGIFPVSTGPFTIRVDNDLEDPGTTNTDTNGEVMLTALGRTGAGNGRAQARVQVILDDPFKHVCSSDDVQAACATYTGDDPCTQAGIYVQPCQPEDPHGPKVFPGLPSPTTIGIPALGDGRRGCIPTWSATYIAENLLGPLADVKVIGNADPAQSYFDMALGLDALNIFNAVGGGVWIPDAPGAPARNRRGYCPVAGVGGCNLGDPALGNANLHPNTLGCGLVVDVPVWTAGGGGGSIKYINKLANAPGETTLGSGVVVYVTGIVNTDTNTHVQGTVVLHGNSVPASDVLLSPRFCANRLSAAIQCGAVNTTLFNAGSDGLGNLNAPGYPFAMIIHHPGIGAGGDPPPPQQNTVAQLSSTGVVISGIIFSTGNVEFNPIQVDGGVVAYGVDIQGNTQFVYNNAYGSAAKKGVSIPAGAFSAQFMRSTWLHCRNTDPNSVFTSPDEPATCN